MIARRSSLKALTQSSELTAKVGLCSRMSWSARGTVSTPAERPLPCWPALRRRGPQHLAASVANGFVGTRRRADGIPMGRILIVARGGGQLAVRCRRRRRWNRRRGRLVARGKWQHANGRGRRRGECSLVARGGGRLINGHWESRRRGRLVACGGGRLVNRHRRQRRKGCLGTRGGRVCVFGRRKSRSGGRLGLCDGWLLCIELGAVRQWKNGGFHSDSGMLDPFAALG